NWTEMMNRVTHALRETEWQLARRLSVKTKRRIHDRAAIGFVPSRRHHSLGLEFAARRRGADPTAVLAFRAAQRRAVSALRKKLRAATRFAKAHPARVTAQTGALP